MTGNNRLGVCVLLLLSLFSETSGAGGAERRGTGQRVVVSGTYRNATRPTLRPGMEGQRGRGLATGATRWEELLTSAALPAHDMEAARRHTPHAGPDGERLVNATASSRLGVKRGAFKPPLLDAGVRGRKTRRMEGRVNVRRHAVVHDRTLTARGLRCCSVTSCFEPRAHLLHGETLGASVAKCRDYVEAVILDSFKHGRPSL
jgi:hypothetical protein